VSETEKDFEEQYRKSIERIPKHMNMVNDKYECALLLKKLNDMIETLSELQDDYYTDYIFNANADQKERLENEGFTEEWFLEIEDRFTRLRSILYGDTISWKKLYLDIAEDVMKNLHFRLDMERKTNEKLAYKLKLKEKKE